MKLKKNIESKSFLQTWSSGNFKPDPHSTPTYLNHQKGKKLLDPNIPLTFFFWFN